MTRNNYITVSSSNPLTASWASPSNGQTITSRTVSLQANASGGSGGINRVAFSAKWNNTWSGVQTDYSFPYAYDWDMCNSGVPNGDIELGLEAWDNAGNHYVYSEHAANYHITKNFNCTPPPSANFDAWPQSGLAPLTVAMHIVSTANITSCSWDYGDGQTGTSCASSHNHTYNTPGTYTVRLTVSGPGGSDTTTRSDYIAVSGSGPTPPSNPSPADNSTLERTSNTVLTWTTNGTTCTVHVWGGNIDISPSGSCASLPLGQQGGGSYTWQVTASNAFGSTQGPEWHFNIKPYGPTNLTASAASLTQISLNWILSSDEPADVDSYDLYYSNGTFIANVVKGTTNYLVGELTCATPYSFYVKAKRQNVLSNASNLASATTANCAPSLPDLHPYAPLGYPFPVVPSSIQGTNAVNTLYAGQPTYFDWYFINSGNATASGNFHVELWVDDTLYIRYPYSNYGAGWTGGFDDWNITISTPGWHTVKLIADPDNTITESAETNNVWQNQFYWTPSAPYSDDMENGINNWTSTGLWHQVDSSSPYPNHFSYSHSWWYGQDSTGNYDTGTANSGDLTSPLIYILSSGYYLHFQSWYETETQGADWDQRWVQISVDGGPFDNVLQLSNTMMKEWLPSPTIDLSSYAGHTIQVRFHFDTIDGTYNDFQGWYIDDFDISTTPPPSCADTQEPNDTPAQATAIAYDQTISADICPNGDYDFYTFTGKAGDKVVVDINAAIYNSPLDSYIYLLDSSGTNVLSFNDDDGTSLDSKLGYVLPADSTYYVKVRAFGHPWVGGANYFYNFNLFIDNTNPSTAEITSPLNDGWINPSLTTITVNADDNQNDYESGINRVEFLWHSADWQNPDWIWLGADYYGGDGWSWDFDTSSLPDQRGGAFYIWAFDWIGNWTGAGVWNLGIDRTLPTVTFNVAPPYGNAPFRDFHTWWNGSDNLSGVASYDVQYRDGTGGTWTNLLTNSTDTYYQFIGVDGHTYYFRTRARDLAGNQSTYTGGNGDGQYSIQICATPPDGYEVDNAYTSARLITTDGITQTHTIHAEGDQDWVKFNATVGVTHTLMTANTGGHADTVLYLYGTDGSNLIDANDDYLGLGWSSRLDWLPTASGTYYAKVVHWDPYAYGCTTAYNLSVFANTGALPTVQFTTTAFSVNESAGTATITATLSAASSQTVTVNYATSNGTAIAGSDYTATSGALTFNPGMTNRTFTVPILNDTVYEGIESFNLTLSAPANAVLGANAIATAAIVDDDPLPTIQFSATAFSVNESAGSAVITATLSNASALTTTVNYATSNGTAFSGSDYTFTSGTLTFGPGVTTRTFTVPIINDTANEGNEALSLGLSNPTNAVLVAPTNATLTITDNDGSGGPVVLAIVPTTTTVGVGQIFNVAVQVQAGAQFVNGAAAYLNFNPAYLQVISLNSGTMLPDVLQNTYNNSTGQINFAAGDLNLPNPSGTFTLVAITFTAVGATTGTAITFNGAATRKSDATLGGASVLDHTEGGTVATANAALAGSVTLQGRPPAPDPRWVTSLIGAMTLPGSASSVYTFTATSDSSGHFTVNGIAPGTYDIYVKNSHTLRNKVTAILTSGSNQVNLGTLREGDANNDNFVSLIDFSILVSTFGKCQGATGYDDRADFDEDQCVGPLDFSLLAPNYGQAGQPSGPALAQVQPQNGSVQLIVDPAVTTIKPGELFTVTVKVQAGAQTIEGAQASLDFNPTLVRVRKITAGTTFPQILQNQYDNTAGTVDFAAGTLSNFPSGTFTLVQIQFEALALTPGTTLAFHTNLPRASEATFGGASVLGGTSNGTIVVQAVVPPTGGNKVYLPLILK